MTGALQSPKVEVACERKDFRGNSDVHPLKGFLCFASLVAEIPGPSLTDREADRVPVQALLPPLQLVSGATFA